MIDKAKIIGVRFTEKEKEQVVEYAGKLGLDMSGFIRLCVIRELRNEIILNADNRNNK